MYFIAFIFNHFQVLVFVFSCMVKELISSYSSSTYLGYKGKTIGFMKRCMF